MALNVLKIRGRCTAMVPHMPMECYEEAASKSNAVTQIVFLYSEKKLHVFTLMDRINLPASFQQNLFAILSLF